MFPNKTLLINVGTAFFGNAVLCGFFVYHLSKTRILSRDEKKIYYISRRFYHAMLKFKLAIYLIYIAL